MLKEDLDLYFQDFAETVSICGMTSNVIFSNETVVSNEVISNAPHVLIKTSEFDALEVKTKSELIFENGDTYSIETIEPDGTGITQLFLSRKWKTYGLR